MLQTNISTPRILVIAITCFLFFTSETISKDELAKEVCKYTNEYRRSKGLKALEMKDDLNDIARKHSEAMASGKRSFGHDGYDQRMSEVQKVIKNFDGDMAENVAAFGASNGKEAVNIWKNSSSHRKNMLGNYKYIGVGTARNSKGVVYYTQIFVR
jgi:uncharacterized protein YkwD